MASFIFSIIINVVEKLFASHLAGYLESYHQKRIVEGKKDDRNIQNAAFNAAPGTANDWLHQQH